MKTIKILTVALFIGASGLLAQTKKDVKVESFTGIHASSAIEVIVTIGSTESVVFEASDEALAKLKAEVKKGKLNLFVDGNLNNSGKMIAFVTAKSLNDLSVSGAASMEVKNTITCDKMDLEATGAGSIKLELNAKDITANAHGAGMIQVKGTTKSLKAMATGAGCLKAEDLKSESVDVTASGAGSAKVFVSENLTANASGAGNVIYSGDPKKTNVNSRSAGSIKKS